MKESDIIKIALRNVSKAFDDFIGACLDGGPTQKDIARARACLPPYCVNAYPKKESPRGAQQ